MRSRALRRSCNIQAGKLKRATATSKLFPMVSPKVCCACLDWSERRFHLGGYVGAALFSLYESKGWLTRHLGYREVTITEKGYAAFKTHFHI
ncbi:ArsR family transcriptional regulator [Escherichia coli]|nr:ArsR family transcriptional regulator [Escherichia coli]